jgi:hypothetical protein
VLYTSSYSAVHQLDTTRVAHEQEMSLLSFSLGKIHEQEMSSVLFSLGKIHDGRSCPSRESAPLPCTVFSVQGSLKM